MEMPGAGRGSTELGACNGCGCGCGCCGGRGCCSCGCGCGCCGCELGCCGTCGCCSCCCCSRGRLLPSRRLPGGLDGRMGRLPWAEPERACTCRPSFGVGIRWTAPRGKLLLPMALSSAGEAPAWAGRAPAKGKSMSRRPWMSLPTHRSSEGVMPVKNPLASGAASSEAWLDGESPGRSCRGPSNSTCESTRRLNDTLCSLPSGSAAQLEDRCDSELARGCRGLTDGKPESESHCSPLTSCPEEAVLRAR
mmetsp:Transcript_82126/g.256475  ORF Transcript_82126/g.256475 Transcript_82126/m.256475 type:complete len:250 (-) Transcript_82126:306-1055(-)